MNFRKILFWTLFTGIFIIARYLPCSAQSVNPCGVIAKISPAATDSVVQAGDNINLTSASINATSVEWLIDGWWSGDNTTWFNFYAAAGTHKISLVAHNGNCSDTTTVYYFCAGQPHDVDSSMFANYGLFNTFEYGTSMDATVDGGFVLGGYGTLRNGHGCGHQGLIVKLRERGCIDWSKAIVDTLSYCGYGDVNKICASSFDSGYYVSGTGFLMKLDKNGNKLWNNIYRYDTWPNYIDPIQMTSDDQGNIYLINKSLNWGWSITKIGSSGNIVWNKYYSIKESTDPIHPNVAWPFGLSFLNGKVYVSGYVLDNAGSRYFDWLTKIDGASGKTEWQYEYENASSPQSRCFDQVSNYDTLAMVSGPTPGGGQSVYLIDPQGNLVKSINAKLNSSYGPHLTKAVADNKGGIYVMQWTEETLNLQPYSYYYTNFLKFDTSLNKYWGLIYPRWNFNDIAMSKNDFGALGTDFGKEQSAFWGSLDMRFLKVNTDFDNTTNYGSYTSCSYYTNDFILSNIPMNRINFNWDIDSVLAVKQEPVTLYTVKDAHIESRYTCPDFVDSCSFMNISGPIAGCSYNSTYTYYLHRNKKCFLQPQWKFAKSVSVVAQTDTSVTVQFPGFGNYDISCELKSCIPAFDSLTVVIRPKLANLNLGKDTVICGQTSITLHAGNKFFTYQWQDGSKDSLFTVTQPGWYWVQVTDSCSNLLRDSILIAPYSDNFIDLGPDRIKCNSDTIHLNAPAGFLNYSWSNNYNISSTTSQNVIVNPLTDTAYFIKAEKTPGCFAYDTVRIHVNTSPPINLGADKSFCRGDSVLFDAGSGFNAYLWNNSASTEQISVKTAGMYSVVGTTAEGCKSYDTVKVINVFTNPEISLDHNPLLCTGSSRILDAGAFSSYLWNDGSTTQKIVVRDTGTYVVEVRDHNGCKGSDTAIITTILPLPTGFLPPDTLICSYDKLTLVPKNQYNSYLWSTGALASSITISQPGEYWLEVKDVNGCVGRDSVVVNPKDCMEGFYIPTAFTPNHDGKNDVFRPLLFGKVKKYQFTIYNRWGKVVFQTPDLNKAWDGNVAGLSQDSNVFVWICTYQFEGEEVRTERGTVMLVR